MKIPILDLRHLQMIRVIAKTGRVTDAAEEIGLTASALSHRIREAERRLGIPLYDRLHKRLRMRPAAVYLAQVADRIMEDLARAEADVLRLDSGIETTVRIAVETYSSYHWLPAFLLDFKARQPAIDVEIVANASGNPLSALQNRVIDVAIVSRVLDRVQTRTVHLFDDPLVLVTQPDDPLCERDYVVGKDLEGIDFITESKVPSPDREFARVFRTEDCYPRWTFTMEVPEAIVEMVAAGHGKSVLAKWAMAPQVRSGRIGIAKIGREGINIPWFAMTRIELREDDPSNIVAQALQTWCNERGTL